MGLKQQYDLIHNTEFHQKAVAVLVQYAINVSKNAGATADSKRLAQSVLGNPERWGRILGLGMVVNSTVGEATGEPGLTTAVDGVWAQYANAVTIALVEG